MKYDVQGVAELYLMGNTDLDAERFEAKFHPDNFIKATLQVVLSDGSTQEIDVIDCLKLQWVLSHKDEENH